MSAARVGGIAIWAQLRDLSTLIQKIHFFSFFRINPWAVCLSLSRGEVCPEVCRRLTCSLVLCLWGHRRESCWNRDTFCWWATRCKEECTKIWSHSYIMDISWEVCFRHLLPSRLNPSPWSRLLHYFKRDSHPIRKYLIFVSQMDETWEDNLISSWNETCFKIGRGQGQLFFLIWSILNPVC